MNTHDSMTVAELERAMETIAPTRRAGDWDNVGLLAGGRDWPAQHVLLTIDLTPAVLDEAIALNTQCIIAYHPPIFAPLKRITDDTWRAKLVLDAIARRIAIYSPHTALDAAPGGVNDWLARGLGPGTTTALEMSTERRPNEMRKIVAFAPADRIDELRSAMADAGAGRIGAYDQCSFRTEGTGTFRGGAGTSPVIGTPGEFKQASEVRLEMACGIGALPAVIAALRTEHPYDEPAFDIHALEPRPDQNAGMGRRIELDTPLVLRDIVAKMTKHLGVNALHIATAHAATRKIRTIGVCAGAGGSLLDGAIRAGCELFFTGEMRYHDVLDGQARGCTIALAGHSNTERGYLKTLQRALQQALGGTNNVDIVISRRDVYPMVTMSRP
jgi:dinuclear metal center YbgI/SA1388 family protein